MRPLPGPVGLPRVRTCVIVNVYVCVDVCECVCLCLRARASCRWNAVLTDFNIAFVVIFAAEAVCKNLAVGPRVYFSRGWSRFDFAVVVVSVVGLFVSEGFGANALRALRVARIIRLVKRARTLRVMFNCFVLSLPSLWNIGSLLFVVIYIFAILGTSRRPVCECRRCGSLAGASLLNCRSRSRSDVTYPRCAYSAIADIP